jgi:hypothetical protein
LDINFWFGEREREQEHKGIRIKVRTSEVYTNKYVSHGGIRRVFVIQSVTETVFSVLVVFMN